MTTYLIRRFFLLLFTLFGICLISFLIASFSPGDPAAAVAGVQIGAKKQGRATDEVLKHTRQILYLDHPRVLNFSPETRSRVVEKKARAATSSASEYERDDAKAELTGEIGTAALPYLVPMLDDLLATARAETDRRRAAIAALEKAGPNEVEAATAALEKIFVGRGPRFGRQSTAVERSKGWLEWARSRTDEPLDGPRRLLEVLTAIVPADDGGPFPPVTADAIDEATIPTRVRTWKEWWQAHAARYSEETATRAALAYLDASDQPDAALAELRKVGSVAAPELVSALSSSGERQRRAAFALSLIVHKSWDMTTRPDQRESFGKEWDEEIAKAEKLDARAREERLKALGARDAFVDAKLRADHDDHLRKWRNWWFRAEEQYVEFSAPRQVVRAFTQTQFGNWLTRLFRGLDFGESYFQHRPVSQLIRDRLPRTMLLETIALILTYLIAIPIGVYSATHPRTVGDTISTVILFMLYSLPSFWVGAMLIMLFTGPPIGWDLFPSHGLESIDADDLTGWAWFKDHALHLVLPVACLTYGGIAYISRQMRAGMLEVIRQDYVRTARAKGLPEKLVVYKHALRNSLIPTITILGYLLPGMFGGSVIIESIFSIDGIGRLMFDAVVQKDLPVVMADVFISGVLTLLGILFADIAYALVDPRIELR